jgi:hypothetical protein
MDIGAFVTQGFCIAGLVVFFGTCLYAWTVIITDILKDAIHNS